MIYVRWKTGEPRRCRVFPPLPTDHPSVTHPCYGCDLPIGHQRPVQLIAIGPTSDDDQAKHDAGRWYSAGAIALHEDCVKLLTDAELDALAAELAVGRAEDADA